MKNIPPNRHFTAQGLDRACAADDSATHDDPIPMTPSTA